MRKTLIFWMFFLAALTAACGTVLPIPMPEVTPSASPPDLTPDPPPSIISIPYGKNIRFEQLSTEDGLSHSVVNAVLQDRTGFLWIGTDDGLNRYDGYEFKVFKPDANIASSLSDRSITSLVEDEAGHLWIGTRTGGLNRYNPRTGQFTHYNYHEGDEQSIASNEINVLCLDENGLWIGTNNGLDFLDFEADNFTHYYTSTQADSQNRIRTPIRALFLDSKGLLWIGTANAGISVYDKRDQSFTIHKFNENNPFSLSHNRVLSITEGQNGDMWIGTGNGLNRYNTEERYFTRYANSEGDPDSLAGNTVYTLFMDRSGGLWAGTNNGLDRYDPQTNGFVHYQYQPTVSNSLSNNQVFTIHEDASGVLWIGTRGGGLNKYNRQQDKFTYYRKNPNDSAGLSSNFIFPILADNEGYIWIGTLDGGLNRFDLNTEQFTYYEHDPNNPATISNDSVISLYQDRQGVLWVGTTRGLDRFDSETNAFLNYQRTGTGNNVTTRETVFAIHEDSNENLWVGTNQGLVLFDRENRTFRHFEIEEDEENLDIFSGHHINAIFEDNERKLWIGTFDDGLKRIDLETNEVLHYRHNAEDQDSLGSNAIMVVHQDQRGTLWIGTYGGGLDRYHPETDSFTHFTENEGLPNNVIYGILEDNQTHLWLSTNNGLSRFDPAAQTFRNYTISDGLQSNEFNQNAYARDQNGRMYFGGINGLIAFTPEEIKDNPYLPKVAMTSLAQDGIPHTGSQTVEYLQSITLVWPQDSFEFEFTSFAYEQPSRNQYAYMLEGFDNDWINIGTQRNGRYTNLPGGAYTLRLRGSNSDGDWNERGKAISVVVVPPFWETWWFLGLVIVVLGISLAGGLRWGVKNFEKRNRELERLVKKRTADLEKRTSEIEALYQADEKILRSVTLNQVFQTLVDVSISILKADRSAVFLWNEEKSRILPHVSRGFQPETLSALHFKYGEGMVGIAMKTSEAVIVSRLKPSELREDIKLAMQKEGIQSYAHFPIVIDGKVVAIFNVAYTRPDALNKDSVRLLTALVNRASLSIANMQLFEQTKDLAVMEERNRLARDLHDSAKQKAFAALAQLGTVNGLIRSKNEEAAPNLNEAENLIYEVIQELNFLIQEIYPIALQEKGLQTILREYVFEWENRNDITANLAIQNGRQLSLDVEQAVYRFVQEALANVARHSKASRVNISLEYHADALQVTIADNGCGFDINQKAKGLGFRSMRDRIGSLRGTIQIQSTPGEGTCLTAQIPIKNTTGEREA